MENELENISTDYGKLAYLRLSELMHRIAVLENEVDKLKNGGK